MAGSLTAGLWHQPLQDRVQWQPLSEQAIAEALAQRVHLGLAHAEPVAPDLARQVQITSQYTPPARRLDRHAPAQRLPCQRGKARQVGNLGLDPPVDADDGSTWALARMNMFLHHADSADIERAMADGTADRQGAAS